ncbi:hypothetical protein Q7P35_000047 [Cladosporium inversicolor]
MPLHPLRLTAERHRTHDLHSIFRRAASSANARVNSRVGPKWKHAKASVGLKSLAIAHALVPLSGMGYSSSPVVGGSFRAVYCAFFALVGGLPAPTRYAQSFAAFLATCEI